MADRDLANHPELYFKEEKEEDCLMCIVNILNPMSYIRLVIGTLVNMTRVCASFRDIRFMDVLSGLICGILMAAFGIVFSYTIFDEAGLEEYIGAGGATQAVAVIVGGFFTSFFSDVGIAISSPDLNPAVFFGNMAVTTRTTMIQNARFRNITRGGVGQEAVFATVLASIIMSVMLLGAILYVIGRFRLTRVLQMLPDTVLTGFMASIGYIVVLKGLRTSMPTNIWRAGAANPEWWYFALPAVGFGMIMYIRMRYDLGPPSVMIPLLIAIPIALFYIIVYATGSNIDVVRAKGWMTPLLSYSGPGVEGIYDASYGNGPLVDWNAVACVPQWFLLWIVITIDVLLKLAAVRKVINTPQMRIEHEVMLMGKQNMICGFFVGCPSYSQPVLSAVNYNIIKNKTSRVPGIIAVFFNLILWVVSYPAVNFLPRFWLAGLIFFSAWGFVVDNLIDSAFRLSISEYLTVWLIVIINAVLGLGWAILCGVVATALIFAVMYGRGGSIKTVNSGADVRSSVVRDAHDDRLLRHIGNTAVVIQMHRYLFFGSATQVLELVQGLIDAQVDTRQVDRARYFIFDFADVEDMDSTAMTVFIEIISKILESNATEEAQMAKEMAEDIAANQLSDEAQEEDAEANTKVKRSNKKKQASSRVVDDDAPLAKPEKMVVLFTGMSKKMRRNLNREKVIKALYDKEYQKIAIKIRASSDAEVEAIPESAKRCFDSIDLGMEWVEERLLERAHLIRKRWLKFESFARLHNMARRKVAQENFDSLMWSTEVSPAEMPKYIERIEVPKGSTLWRAGDLNPQLYLLQSGKLTAYVDRFGVMSRSHSYRRGAFVNEDGLYVDSPVANTVIAETDCVLLALSREHMRKLEQEQPVVAVAIQANVLKYSAQMKLIVARAKHAIDFYRAARFAKQVNKQVIPEAEILDESQAQPVRPATGATRLTEDLKSLMDVTALSQGVRNGRRIAMQFSKQLMSNMDSAPLQQVAVKSTTRTAATNAALAQARTFYQVVRYEDLDERIKTDWSQFAGEGQIARADDVCRVIPSLTTLEAREMIWIADLEDRGGVSFFDLLDTLTTVWEGEQGEPEVMATRGGGATGSRKIDVEDPVSEDFSIE